MKKFMWIVLLLTFLVGCGREKNSSSPSQESPQKISQEDGHNVDAKEGEKKTVTVTTSFLYDMVHQLAPDMVNVQLIIPAGEDPHLYVAKSQDVKKIADADLVLYHGLHFEGKMGEILSKTGYAVSEDFPKAKIQSMEEDGHAIVDPHFWFDISLYKNAVEKASQHLQTLLPQDREKIVANTKIYLQKLDELDAENKAQLSTIPKESRYLITPHDAFQYFSRAYGIDVIAPQGVSTDSEVANRDIDKTADFIVSHKIKAIFAESTTDPARMEKLKETCRAKGFAVEVVSGEGNELFSDSLAPEGQAGDTYIDMYRHNVRLMVSHLK